jgi:hypothetical protein
MLNSLMADTAGLENRFLFARYYEHSGPNGPVSTQRPKGMKKVKRGGS